MASPRQRTGEKPGQTRGTEPAQTFAGEETARPASPKTLEIVDLVEAISSDLGAGNGVYLGSGIARLLSEKYRQRGAVPAWVKELIAHYAERAHEA